MAIGNHTLQLGVVKSEKKSKSILERYLKDFKLEKLFSSSNMQEEHINQFLIGEFAVKVTLFERVSESVDFLSFLVR